MSKGKKFRVRMKGFPRKLRGKKSFFFFGSNFLSLIGRKGYAKIYCMDEQKNNMAWVAAVDMGYGHQRAAYPLKYLAYGGEIINANAYKGIPEEDVKIWHESQSFYNFISRFKNFPVIGEPAFNLFDKFQAIPKFYPKRDLSRSNFQLLSSIFLIEKGWGKHFVEKLKTRNIPFISTFFVPAYMAEIHGFSPDIYILLCDADVSRVWAPVRPKESKIKYLAPNERVVERLKLYGVPKDKIFLSGFPLPLENLGDSDLTVLKADLCARLANLDPKSKFLGKYNELFVERKQPINCAGTGTLSITFAVGGAGAQRELGMTVVKSMAEKIRDKKVHINLIAGIHKDIYEYFDGNVKDAGLGDEIGKGIKIVFDRTKDGYFKKFNEILRHTDILWTKPSELSFYSGLGLPIIMAPPIGSQEKFNQSWLLSIGAGIEQEDPRYANEWIFDWLEEGIFVEAAISGYFKAERGGTYNVEKIVFGKLKYN